MKKEFDLLTNEEKRIIEKALDLYALKGRDFYDYKGSTKEHKEFGEKVFWNIRELAEKVWRQ